MLLFFLPFPCLALSTLQEDILLWAMHRNVITDTFYTYWNFIPRFVTFVGNNNCNNI